MGNGRDKMALEVRLARRRRVHTATSSPRTTQFHLRPATRRRRWRRAPLSRVKEVIAKSDTEATFVLALPSPRCRPGCRSSQRDLPRACLEGRHDRLHGPADRLGTYRW